MVQKKKIWPLLILEVESKSLSHPGLLFFMSHQCCSTELDHQTITGTAQVVLGCIVSNLFNGVKCAVDLPASRSLLVGWVL